MHIQFWLLVESAMFASPETSNFQITFVALGNTMKLIIN